MTPVKTKKKFPYRVVEVLWVDSEHNSSWDTLSDILEENSEGSLECRSAGFLVADKPDRIILATSISAFTDEADEEQVSAYITIPRAAILSIRELSVKREKKKIDNS